MALGRGYRSRVTGELVAGPETLTDEELGNNRSDYGNEVFSHPLDDEYWKARTPDWSKVTVPFFSAGNWGGQPLHPRGNIEGFVRAASKQKWLEMHGIEHWTHFYTDYGGCSRSVFRPLLKGIDSGWKNHPCSAPGAPYRQVRRAHGERVATRPT
jgi:predicted acyl esterase